MNCLSVQQGEIAEKYLIGQLDPAQQDEFEVHILECGACLQSVETLQNMQHVLREREHEIRLASPARVSRVWYWAFAAACVAVLAGIGVRQWRHRRDYTTEARIVRPETSVAVGYEVPPPPREPMKQTKEPERLPARRSQPKVIVPSNTPAEPKPLAGTDSSTQTALVTPKNSGVVPEVKSALVVKKQQPELTQEQAVELYKLGEIRPVPYSFAGLAGNAKFTRHLANGAVPGGAGPAGVSEFNDAMVAYVDGRYAKAASLLEQAATHDRKTPEINFYRGVCSLLLGHPDEALAPLMEVIQDGKTPLVQPAHIYMARAYLQKIELKQAEAELQAATALPGPRTQEAMKLLERVRALRASVESVPGDPVQ